MPTPPIWVQCEGDREASYVLKADLDDGLLQCPAHRRGLMLADSGMHGMSRDKAPNPSKVYPCRAQSNAYKFFGGVNAGTCKLCDRETYYVCPEQSCNHSVCAACVEVPLWKKQLLKIRLKIATLLRRGTSSVAGLFMMFVAQSMYLPASTAAIMVLTCNSQLACQFPDCHKNLSSAAFILVIGSVVIVVLVTVGLPIFCLSLTWYRKVRIAAVPAVRARATIGGAPVMPPEESGATSPTGLAYTTSTVFMPPPTSPGHGGPRSGGAYESDDAHDSEQPEDGTKKRTLSDYIEAYRMQLSDEDWTIVLSHDKTIFKGLYEQYEFRYMTQHFFTFVFKLVILLVVLNFGEPGSLRQIVGCGGVEGVELLTFILTEPFVDPTIDLLAKFGALHQVAQVALLLLFRADNFEDPDRRLFAFLMVICAVAYFIATVAVIVKVVVLPWWKRRQEAKRKEAEAAAAMLAGTGTAGTEAGAVAAGAVAAVCESARGGGTRRRSTMVRRASHAPPTQ